MAEKKYTLKPVKELPQRRFRRETIYDDIVEDFLESNEKYAEVTVEGKKPETLLSALRKRAKNKNLKVMKLSGKVYLERT